MGTKRPFDEDLQEFMKHPKHLDNGNKPDSLGEEKPSLEPSQNVVIAGEGDEKVFETSAPLPLVTGITGHEEASAPGPGPGPGPAFCPNLFSEFYEFNLPRRPLVHYDDTYSSLLDSDPRKEVPVGAEHQADVPEYDSDSARTYTSNDEREKILMGICVVSDQEGEIVIPQTDCECADNGSVRCVQQHVNEARLNLKQSLGLETFINLGFDKMGEEVSGNWTEEEEQHFQDVIYSNPVSHGKRFWEVLSVEFPTCTKKELVSYYFNVFIYRRRAVQNRSHLLAIDSDDDEWWGTKRGSFGPAIEDDDDLVVVGPFVDHEYHDHDSSSKDGDIKENEVMNASRRVIYTMRKLQAKTG
ncbi:AT-rich interactive domain-containing protein 1-like [Bidens hawaiensis]|uniref:AT-rich interactive domain-containing protein 1-like n=1 Tax=Bidens hawaiensis TaxID=980011 RepID=UPI00404B2DDF